MVKRKSYNKRKIKTYVVFDSQWKKTGRLGDYRLRQVGTVNARNLNLAKVKARDQYGRDAIAVIERKNVKSVMGRGAL